MVSNNILTGIFVVVAAASIWRGITRLEDNYFFPLTLHEIKIDLKYKDTNVTTWSNYDSDRHNSFVFRLTLLKNLDLLK